MRTLSVALMALASFLEATPAMAANATADLVDPNLASGITADVIFHDDGSRLRVLGTAQGMGPTKRYISLIYDPGSTSTGPTACLPTQPPPPPATDSPSTRCSSLTGSRLGVVRARYSQSGSGWPSFP